MPRGRGRGSATGRNTAPDNPSPQNTAPGALSSRSDSSSDPTDGRQMHSEHHGQGNTLSALDQAGPDAPSSSGPGAGAGGQRPNTSGPSPAPQLPDVFAPSQRRGGSNRQKEPSSPVQDDPDTMIRALYAQYPHPDISRLLQRRWGDPEMY